MQIDYKDQIQMFCNDPECPCDKLCCQTCDKMLQCENKCKNVTYKNKLYGDYNYLSDELDSLAEKQDSALYAIAAQVIRHRSEDERLREENKKLRAVRDAAQGIINRIDVECNEECQDLEYMKLELGLRQALVAAKE